MLVRISQGKGRKDRLVPLSLQLLQTLREYYKLNRPGEWLFPSEDQSEPMKVAEVRTIWNLAKRKAGIAAGGVHSLRHAFATNMLEQGVDLYSLQQILGHSNIQSTARYLSMTNTISRAVGDKIDVLLKAVTPSA
jgi:site-specific recombinase XerD